MNRIGCYTLFCKETMRFGKVWLQTVAAPVLTALLYQLVFSHALGGRTEALRGVPYAVFLIPGLAVMGMAQSAFANTSSSLIQSRLSGNLVFVLLPPLSAADLFAAYTGAAVLRGFAVGLGILSVSAAFGLPWPQHPVLALLFAFSGCFAMAALGFLAGIWAEKYDQLAAFQNFLIVPLTFLSGAFYSLHSLPPFWQAVSRANPVFYLTDGFRYAFFGVSDAPAALSLAVCTAAAAALSAAVCLLLRLGWRLRQP